MFDQLAEGIDSFFSELSGKGYTNRLTALAGKRGGQFYPATGGFFSRQPARIEVPARDALVRVDTFTVSSGENSTTYQRARASYLMGAGPEFTIRREGVFGSIGKALGFQDIELGHDRHFDSTFIVKTTDPTGTRDAWTEPARRLMLRGHISSTVRATHSHVDVSYLFERARNTEKLEAAIDLAGHLASYGGHWFAQLRQLPGAEYIPPVGGFEARRVPLVHVPIRNTTVGFYPTLDGRQFAFTASARLERKMTPFHETFETDERTGELDGTVFPEGAKEHLHNAAPGHLEIGGDFARFTVHGTTDQRRLMAAANLVVAIARGSRSQGAFR